jgi:HPt (histidine-containing phosphotransfer) domain-containing protein
MAGHPIETAGLAQLQASTGADFVRELLDAFLADAPQLLRTLRSAQAAGDAVAFRRAAHSLKSNANSFGASALSALARELEETGLSAPGDAEDARLDRLEQAYETAAAALHALCHG